MRYECFSLSTEIPLKRFAFGPNLVTVAPPEFEIYGFVKVMWLSESDTSSTYGWVRRDIFSKMCVFCPSLVTADSQEVEIWTFPRVTGYVTMTSPASGNACSLLWTYLNSCIYCPSLVTIALLENIFLLKRMKTFNSRNVVKVKHYFKWNAFKSLYSCKVAETITCCTYFLD